MNTVYLCQGKWYHFSEERGNETTHHQFEELESIAARMGVSAYCDHIPNPKVLIAWAKEHGAEVDIESLEACVGRWHVEVLNEYDQ